MACDFSEPKGMHRSSTGTLSRGVVDPELPAPNGDAVTLLGQLRHIGYGMRSKPVPVHFHRTVTGTDGPLACEARRPSSAPRSAPAAPTAPSGRTAARGSTPR